MEALPPQLAPLVAQRRWVCWQLEERDGRRTKVPVVGTDPQQRASSTDPRSWRSYEHCAALCRQRPELGLGFVLTGSGFWVIDLDHCVNADGVITEEAAQLVHAAATYTEWSPSAAGLHLWGQGSLPAGTPHKQNGHEWYDQDRFMTVTGLALRGAEEPAMRRTTPEELAALELALFGPRVSTNGAAPHAEATATALTDDAVLGQLFAAKNGAKARALWHGESAGYPSESEADYALLGQLRFYTRNAAQLERLLKESSRARPKFDEARGESTYLRYSIEQVLAGGGATYTPPAARNGDEPLYHLTDLGNAERLVRDHQRDLRYCDGLGGWLVYDERRWARDDTGEVHRRANQVARGLHQEASRITEELARQEAPQPTDQSAEAQSYRKRLRLAQALPAWAHKSQSEGRLVAMVNRARVLHPIPIGADAFDRDPWLLTCQNGTLDLRTGQLCPQRRDELMTKLAGCAYEPRAACPRWLRFLDRIMGGNTALIAYLQRLVGYSLTGDTGEEIFVLLHGTGRNGKSKFLETVAALLGDYASTTPFETLLHSDHRGIPNDLARLRGARFVSATEPDAGRRLDESLVKQLTGGDTIAARFLNHEFFTFRPGFKLWLAANHKPAVRGTDLGIWARIKLVPFTVTIPKGERDPKLLEKLLGELPGILAWAVQGCLAWQRQGIGEPEEVTAATAGYREEEDVLGPFFAERCVLEPQAVTLASELYAAYKAFTEGGGEKPLSPQAFGRRLADRGLTRERESNVGRQKRWRGVMLTRVGGER